MLALADVHVRYGRVRAVQGLSLEVHEGELVCLVGHNGVGKTTTLMTITGVLRPAQGSVSFDGRRIDGLPPDRIVRMGISLVPENRRIFSRLSVGENLLIGTSGLRDRRAARIEIEKILDRFPVLRAAWDKPGSQLSGGEQQMLALGRALVARPRLLLLDEPTLGLAPLIVDRVFETLQELKQDGVTILLVEQNAMRTLDVADRIYVLRPGGRLQFHGTSAALREAGVLEAAFSGVPVARTA